MMLTVRQSHQYTEYRAYHDLIVIQLLLQVKGTWVLIRIVHGLLIMLEIYTTCTHVYINISKTTAQSRVEVSKLNHYFRYNKVF